MRRWALAASILAAGSPLAAAEACVTLEPKAVAGLFDDWNFALSSLDPSKVVQRYWPNAVLLPTVSNTPRTNAAMIGDYFEHFLAKRPRGRIDTRTIQSGCNLAMDVGTYTFSLMDDKGTISEVAARYTFVYQYREGAWKILHHHSSAMPERGETAVSPNAHASIDHSPSAEAPQPAVHAEPAKSMPERPKGKSKSTQRAAAPVPAVDKSEPAPPAEVRTPLFANLASSPPPSKFYPPEARKRKEHGLVNLKVCTDDSGTVVGTPQVMKSSDSKWLDEAAQTWAREAKWVPATFNRRRVEGCTQIDVAFEATA